MTKSSSITEEPKPLRRSARLLEANALKIQRSNSNKQLVVSSSCQETRFKGSIEIVLQGALPRNGVSSRLTKKINGVEGFQGVRRSPRFSTPQISDLKCSVKESRFKNSGGLGFQDCKQIRVKSKDGVDEIQAPRFTTPEISESRRKCRAKESTRKNNLQVLNEENCVEFDDDLLQLALFTPVAAKSGRTKSLKIGKKSIKVMSLRDIDTPCKGKAIVEDVADSPQEMALTHFRTPFSSIDNITPENAIQNVSNKLVLSKSLMKRNVRSARVAIKQNVRSTNKQGSAQGWTVDQEMALQRAYFGAKPSPHIWKKISKLVPGKSAQECFDKIQMDSITTPQPQLRHYSKANRTNPSPVGRFSLSGGKLLESTKLNVKKPKGNKRTKSHAHKAVRHLLQKQNLANQGFKRDLFSILESTTSSFPDVAPEPKVLATPQCKVGTPGYLHENRQRSSSSSQQKSFSRFKGSSCLASIVSPPVLKRVKNMAIHEKYIDQLHNREAKRTAAGRRQVSASENMKENVKKLDVIQEAKNNLVSEARDMIKKFQHMQANAMDISDGSSGSDDGECSI